MSVNNCNKLYKEAFDILEKEPVRYGDSKLSNTKTLGEKLDEIKSSIGIDLKSRILGYTESDYKKINRSYLDGNGDPDFQYLFSFNGDYPKTTYRGTMISKDKLNRLSKGDLINNKIILSSTKDFDTAEMFAENPSGNVKGKQVIIEFDNSDSSAYDISEFSLLPNEQEVLVAPDSVLEVQSIKVDDSDMYRLKVKVLNADEQTSKMKEGKQNITNIMSLTGGAVLLDKGIGNNGDTK